MPEPSQAKRRMAIETPLGADVLLVRRCVVREQINRPFQIDVDLTSKKNDINFDEIIGKNVTVRVEASKGQTRYFNGYVARFVQTKSERSFSVYQATLVPWLWFLTRSADCRIFQKTMDEPPDPMTVPGILKKVFKDHGFEEHFRDDGLSGSFRAREFCVQYRETAFNFVSRLMEHEGIAYFFEHSNGAHKLVLANSATGHNPLPQFETIPYLPHVQSANDQEAITDWIAEREVQSGNYLLNDFDFENPRQALQHGLVAAAAGARAHDLSDLEIYDYPGDYPARSDGEAVAQLRIEELQARHEILRGQGTTPGLSAGFKFTLERHPRVDQNRECLVTSVTYEFDEGEFETGGGTGKSSRRFLSCQFTAMPATQPFRPARVTPKPQIQGPQTAIVVGPSGEEIHTDKYGRIKAQFHWDRYGQGDENASCWIRVSQTAAGSGWGAISIPRIGQEVIVEFLEGDPDRPIVTGRVYNAVSTVPYTLPANQTMTTFKTNSTKGGAGFNEIRLEDKKGSEQVFLHGEKDLEVRVKNDTHTWVGNEQHLIVKKDLFETIEGNSNRTVKGNTLSKIEGELGESVKGAHHAQVDGADHLTIKGDHFAKIDGDVNQTFGKNLNLATSQKISIKAGADYHAKAAVNFAIDAGGAVHIKGASSVVIEGNSQVSLKCGGSFVDVGPSGVSISGPMVKINSGGAAGSGAGCSPTAPVAAEPPDPPKDPKEAANAEPGKVDESPPPTPPPTITITSSATQVLKQAAQDGTPFCEECARAAEEEAATVTSWIEFELVGDDDKPVSGEPYRVTLPDGTVEEGTLDDSGCARLERFEAGSCKISFPDLDEEAWEEV